MSNIPPWYDHDLDKDRTDVWPFQKYSKTAAKELAKTRLLGGVKQFIKAVPEGWSVAWKVRRGYTFRVERSTKTLRVPFPRTYAGTAVLAGAVHLAQQIRAAEFQAASYGGIPVYEVSAFGMKSWRFMSGGTIHTPPRFHAYDVVNDQMWSKGAMCLSYQKGVWKKVNIASAREVLRYMSSPHAWKITPSRKGHRRYRNERLANELLHTIAYRKLLLDYLKVNDPQHPLPKRAKALLEKHVPTPTP